MGKEGVSGLKIGIKRGFSSLFGNTVSWFPVGKEVFWSLDKTCWFPAWERRLAARIPRFGFAGMAGFKGERMAGFRGERGPEEEL